MHTIRITDRPKSRAVTETFLDGTLAVGRTLPGRGAWLCAGSLACVEQARSRGAFGRALRGPVDEAALDTLTAELSLGAPATLSCRRDRPRED